MDQEIITYAPSTFDSQITKRIIADAIRVYGSKKISPYSNGGKEQTYVEYIAQMIWDAVTEGVIYFAGGESLNLQDDPKSWADLVKFICTHLDGSANIGNQFSGINIFKVYRNIDPDLV